MYIKELTEIINSMADEIGCNGGISTASHNIPSNIVLYDEENNQEYELISLEERRLQCGCSIGITFNIKKIYD